jgi:hypothetical protein
MIPLITTIFEKKSFRIFMSLYNSLRKLYLIHENA